MTAFVDSCIETAADSAAAVARKTRRHPGPAKLLRALAGKKNILITTHVHPDPDALASSVGLHALLTQKLREVDKDVKITLSVKGRVGGGVNEVFVRNSSLRLAPWDDAALSGYDSIILLDTQPQFAFSPLPAGTKLTAVIDHHRGRVRKRMDCDFCDIRPDVGATSSIIFSYFFELELAISPNLGATLLYGIESDLAGAAGAPGELDNIALSSLTLVADPRKLYQMRYVALPQSHFVALADGLNNAVCHENAILSHLASIDSMEKPAIVADLLLRYDKAQWAMVTAVDEMKLIASIRTNPGRQSAADMARHIFRHIGEGGGHRTKAGGYIALATGSAGEIDKWRKVLRRRYLRYLKIAASRGRPLIDHAKCPPSARPAEPASNAAPTDTPPVASQK